MRTVIAITAVVAAAVDLVAAAVAVEDRVSSPSTIIIIVWRAITGRLLYFFIIKYFSIIIVYVKLDLKIDPQNMTDER